MRQLIPGVRGLSLATTVVQLGAYLLVSWAYAERVGVVDEVVDGLRWLVHLPFDWVGVPSPVMPRE